MRPDDRAARWGVVSATILNKDRNGNQCTAVTQYDPQQCRYLKPANDPTGPGVGMLDIQVQFRDPWQSPVMRVTYRWRFRSEGVKMWAAVEPLATPAPMMVDGQPVTGVPFLKEPKFLAGLRGNCTTDALPGPSFTRMSVLTNNARDWGSGHMRGKPCTAGNVRTSRSLNPNRVRVRWDFPSGTPNDYWEIRERESQPPRLGMRDRDKRTGRCPKATDPPSVPACFSVLARAYNPDLILSGDTSTGRLSAEPTPWHSGKSRTSPEAAQRPNLIGQGLD